MSRFSRRTLLVAGTSIIAGCAGVGVGNALKPSERIVSSLSPNVARVSGTVCYTPPPSTTVMHNFSNILASSSYNQSITNIDHSVTTGGTTSSSATATTSGTSTSLTTVINGTINSLGSFQSSVTRGQTVAGQPYSISLPNGGTGTITPSADGSVFSGVVNANGICLRRGGVV